jgi:hypothetical protein
VKATLFVDDRACDAVKHDEPVSAILHSIARDYEDIGIATAGVDL